MPYVTMLLAVFLGTIASTALRAYYYIGMGYRTEMSPYIMIMVSPVLALMVTAVALVSEWALSFTKFSIEDRRRALIIGLSYAGMTLALFERWTIFLPLVINPFTARYACRWLRE